MNGKTETSHRGRLSSFEAVRIVAILMVLVVHCVRNKFEVTDPHTLAIECGWLSWEECVMASFGILGVNLFILISGWFGIRLSARGVFGIFFVITRVRDNTRPNGWSANGHRLSGDPTGRLIV